jgi:hypothetical protein
MDGVFTPQEPTDFFKRRVAEINEDLNRQEGVSIPNPYNKAETIIDRLINKNVRINLGDESKSLSDIDLPKQSLFDTKIQTPPVVTAPIDPTITNQTSAQGGSTLPPNFASLSTAEKLKALQDIGITIR